VRKSETVNAKELDSLWQLHGVDASIGVREKLVILSAHEIAQVGILEFNAKSPCATLGVQTSLVNYYFGGREGLMAEAAYLVHSDWIATVTQSLTLRESDPRKQLHKIVNAELGYYKKWGEMALFAAYPNSSPLVRTTFHEKYQDRLQADLEYYLAVLAVLIHDARAGKKSLIDFDQLTVPKHKMATHARAFLAATSLSWSIHGLGLWAAGQYVASQNIEDKRLSSMTLEFAQRHHIKHIIDSALGE
jgi:AcrR family transcriptional regulator